jgi:hypothetical protein
MNDLIMNVNPTDLLNQAGEIEPSELSKLGATDWIPLMSVAHYLSGSVDKGVAKAGEFVLGGQTSLGTKIKAVPLAYRLHVALINTASNEFVENKYCMMGQTPDEGYRTLATMAAPENCVISEGADMFFYLPEQDSFAQFFMKGQIAKDVQAVWTSGRGGKVVILTTSKQENKQRTRKWFRIAVSTTSSSLTIANVGDKDIPIDVDMYKKYLGQFSNPVKAVAETVKDDGNTESIER